MVHERKLAKYGISSGAEPKGEENVSSDEKPGEVLKTPIEQVKELTE